MPSLVTALVITAWSSGSPISPRMLRIRSERLARLSLSPLVIATNTGISHPASWSPNVALSPSFDSHIGWPNQNKIGDYYDMISDKVGAHLAYATTFNGEQDVYYLRIGDYDCDGNGIGDSDDLVAGTSDDCNNNDIPDSCEIAAGVLADTNQDGIPDVCLGDPVPAISAWGLIVTTLLLLASGAIGLAVIGRRRMRK